MDNERIMVVRLEFTRSKALFFLTAFFICWRPGFLGSEQLTLTTYYPAPYGGYASLLTTGQTLLARDGGNVGIGTSSPGAKLEVKGAPGLTFKIIDGSEGAGKVLTSDATGAASWQTGAMPPGAVISFNLTTCPPGWTELTSARGRYVVGLPAGGTLAGETGTALSNQENRPVGRHAHGLPVYVSGSSGNAALGNYSIRDYSGQSAAAGPVAGTNAPYIQLLTCQKI